MSDVDPSVTRARDIARARAKARVEAVREATFDEEAPVRVVPKDLADLPNVKLLLVTLNDPYAAANRILRLVDEIPVLRSRCRRRAVRGTELEVLPTLTEALSRIGNIGLEAELFGVLEDLTMLAAETPPELL